MTNKFKAALAAASLAGAIIATGAEVDVDGFEIDIVKNQAVAETVSGADANTKPVEPFIVIAKRLGGADGAGGDGAGGDGGDRGEDRNRDGGDRNGDDGEEGGEEEGGEEEGGEEEGGEE